MKKWLLDKLELKSFPSSPGFYFWHLLGLFARRQIRKAQKTGK